MFLLLLVRNLPKTTRAINSLGREKREKPSRPHQHNRNKLCSHLPTFPVVAALSRSCTQTLFDFNSFFARNYRLFQFYTANNAHSNWWDLNKGGGIDRRTVARAKRKRRRGASAPLFGLVFIWEMRAENAAARRTGSDHNGISIFFSQQEGKERRVLNKILMAYFRCFWAKNIGRKGNQVRFVPSCQFLVAVLEKKFF